MEGKKIEKFEKVVNGMVNLATLLMVVSYLPQLAIAWGTKNVQGQSLTFWLLLSFSLGILTLQQLVNFLKGCKVNGLIFQAINFSLAVMMLIAVIVF